MSPPPTAVVLGLGVVGSATSALLRANGFRVLGYDTDAGASAEFTGERISRPSDVDRCDLFVVCVPTPTIDGRQSTTQVESAFDWILAALPAAGDALVAVRSTLLPGTLNRLDEGAIGRRLPGGRGSVCYWPCFARERMAAEDEANPRAVVFGTSDPSRVQGLFGNWFSALACPIHIVSPVEAELAKSAANAANALKISYFNALNDWASAFDANGQVVADVVASTAEAVWNPGYGTRVGPAFGGACLPKDLAALIGFLAESGAPHGALLEAVRAVNQHPARKTNVGPSA